ncbi:formate/nitrite transporter family protein [Enterovirga rhinocerotis]|uniref:Formate/nitrite transporter n=1 Tax=Enterovirga rhinocerotis TaxID=1339210 RepID=A0A4R7BWP7_9HYPH|nr:formate/nitrite transporter family protein [Enterovirga rhinocerotis]TDR89612.1 formate/nitrite transporter [Enterovirga rhinocerotis]
MAHPLSAPEPADLREEVFAALADKAALPASAMIVLGLLAGVYIGIGGILATVALAGAEAMPYGAGQVLAGLVFSVGLGLVIVAGAELFTGNTMMTAVVADGRIGAAQALKALGIVYLANLAGAVLLALLVLGAGLHEAGDGAVGRAAVELGQAKVGNPFAAMLASGILANMLVCLAVWMAYAGRTLTQKLAGLTLPVAAFVAAGFEHSVANMYLLPYALMVQGSVGGAGDAVSLAGIAGNLVPATLGNILGGSLVGFAYATSTDEAGEKTRTSAGR